MYRKGITLIELVVSMAIMIIVLTMVSSIFVNSNKVYKTGISEVDMQNNVEKAMYNLSSTISKAEDIKIGETNIPSEFKETGKGIENLVYIMPKNMNSSDASPIVYYIKNSNGKYGLYERTYELEKNGTTTEWVIDGAETDYALINSIYNFFLLLFDYIDSSDISISDVSIPSYYQILDLYYDKRDKCNYVIAQNTNRHNQMCCFKLKQLKIDNITYKKANPEIEKEIADGFKKINIEKADSDDIYNIKLNYEIGSNERTTETSVAIRNYGGM